MTDAARSLPELTHEAVDLLCRELGVANTLRFLRQFRDGAGNYTEDRQNIPLEEIIAEARRMQGTGESP
jgi:hypothetical protein